MAEQNDNRRKTKLIMAMLIAIIALLFAGIIYQFVVIKDLQRKVNNNTASYVCVVEQKTNENLLKF